MAKIHQCTNPYSVRAGKVPVRFSGGEILLEDDKGNVFRLVNGQLVPVDGAAFNAESFRTTEWETASAPPGKKKVVRKKKDADEADD